MAERVDMAGFYSGIYRQLEIFALSHEGKQGSVWLKKKGETWVEQAGNTYYSWIKFPLQPECAYELEVRDVEAPLLYLSGCDGILDTGVSFLEFDEEGTKLSVCDAEHLSRYYDSPLKEQYHFLPVKNWMNDPNGLCWFNGYYHLYYQANPFGQEWNNMYWGHAVSKDLLHWRHLPIALEPQEELLDDPTLKGGAFSGSAVTDGVGIKIYFTRHKGPAGDGPDTQEYQAAAYSPDGLTFAGERPIITKKPSGVGVDFRDPKVTWIDGKWHMALGSSINEKGAILHYISDDGEEWSYAGVLVQEEIEMRAFECPDFFTLDGKYVAVGALMCYKDEQGRESPIRYYIGELNEGRFREESRGECDFGNDYYAVQTFEHEGRRIMFGWVCDRMQEHVVQPAGTYGSMSLPRELSVRDRRLYQKPVEEVYSLVGEKLYEGGGENVTLPAVQGNSYYARIKLKGKTDFRMVLAAQGAEELALVCKDGVTELVSSRVDPASVRYIAGVKDLTEIEIFMDRRVAEVYLNGGEAAGTKLFYSMEKLGRFSAEFEKPDMAERVEVNLMRSVWM